MSINDILGVMREYGIRPEDPGGVDLPEIGRIDDAETTYSTSIEEVFAEGYLGEELASDFDDARLEHWRHEIEQIAEARRGPNQIRSQPAQHATEPPEPYCAWYCPIHFFGKSWGIYIREHCILLQATEIASFIDWSSVPTPIPSTIFQQLMRSTFYAYYLHEQFHHKVESLAFRLLVATGSDRYRPYKQNVYRKVFQTPDCLEESLANADSYIRLNEDRYIKKLVKPIRDGLREFLKASFAVQPPGYAEARFFLTPPSNRRGLLELQSQVLDGQMPPKTPPRHWHVAPDVIKSLMNISKEIYVILPVGARPIFHSRSIDPQA